MTLTLIGYWRGTAETTSHLPDPHDLVDPRWNADERDAAWFYFASGTLFRTFMGYSPCRICGQDNGAVEFTDGTYVWPEGLAHYIEEHSVRLPEVLTQHALNRLNRVEGIKPDADWWVGAAGASRSGPKGPTTLTDRAEMPSRSAPGQSAVL